MRHHFRLLLSAAALISATLADVEPYVSSDRFDAAKYGNYPVQTFKSSPLNAPILNVVAQSELCDDELYTLLTPRGNQVPEASTLMYDADGHLVWTSAWPGELPYNLLVQEYKGEKYLTFWAGNDAVGGHGAGHYYMLDKHYQLFKTIEGGNGLAADLHEFHITKEGTALMTLYEVVHRDLAPYGEGEGAVWDGIIQEVDIETGEVLFQWRAFDYFTLADTNRIGSKPIKTEAWDWYHINSVDKDKYGNYLVSARWLSLTYINGTTGEVIWVMGGKRNMFKDLSGGMATSFYGQHDARWSENHEEITMFDNSIDDANADRAVTRGLRLRVDQKRMTVEVVAEYKPLHRIRAMSQGSLQTLPNGNVLVGYGNSAAWSEHAHQGQLLCQVNVSPEKHFGKGEVQSYRVKKFDWEGYPLTPPDVALVSVVADITEPDVSENNTSLYVSWNGATEVEEWALEGSSGPLETDKWTELDRVDRTGFETAIKLKLGYPKYLRAVGLDWEGNVLGTSAPITMNDTQICEDETVSRFGASEALISSGAMVLAAMLCFGAYKSVHFVRRWRASVGRGLYKRVDAALDLEPMSPSEVTKEAEPYGKKKFPFSLMGR
ncbi:ASST-domain-containing protein [Xylariales sp. PMI_506]|nr:ASST-domain-containing protein [Xylariales sp. PMI_506]